MNACRNLFSLLILIKALFNWKALCLFSFILVSGLSWGESLDATAWKILQESPGYRSELYSTESEVASLQSAGNLPDLEIGGEYLVAPVSEDNRWAAELSWGLEWPGVYGARNRESDKKAAVARLQLDAKRRESFIEIKNLLLDYIQCRKKIQLLEELNLSNDTIYRLAEQSAKGGEMTLLDLNKVKIENANVRGSKAALLDEEAGIINSLSEIYGGDCAPLLAPMECEFPLPVLPEENQIETWKKWSPEVLAANAEAQAALQSSNVAKMEALPSLSVGYKHAYEEGTHFNGALLGISIPIFSSRHKQKAAKAEILSAEFKAETAATAAETEIRGLYKRLDLMISQITEIAPLVENEDYAATLMKAYQAGVITLIDYLTERNYFTTAALDLINLRHAAAKTSLQLQKYLPLPN